MSIITIGQGESGPAEHSLCSAYPISIRTFYCQKPHKRFGCDGVHLQSQYWEGKDLGTSGAVCPINFAYSGSSRPVREKIRWMESAEWYLRLVTSLYAHPHNNCIHMYTIYTWMQNLIWYKNSTSWEWKDASLIRSVCSSYRESGSVPNT